MLMKEQSVVYNKCGNTLLQAKFWIFAIEILEHTKAWTEVLLENTGCAVIIAG